MAYYRNFDDRKMKITRRDQRAEISEYSSGTARIMISLPIAVALEIADKAVSGAGSLPIEIVVDGKSYDALAIETRVDTFDPITGDKLSSSPGVGSFQKMKPFP